MEVQKFSDFLNEARTNKADVITDLVSVFKSKPNIEMKSLANERGGLYSMAGLKNHLSGKYSSAIIDGAFHDLSNDKTSDMKHLYVKVAAWGESIPYYYIGISDDQAKKLKTSYENEEKTKNKGEIDKSTETKKSAKAVVAAKAEVKKEKAAEKKAKPAADKAERKPGAPRKKAVTKKK